MSQPETTDAIRQLARETAAKVPLKLVQILLDEVAIADVIEAALLRAQQVQREVIAQKVEALPRFGRGWPVSDPASSRPDGRFIQLADVLAALRSQEIP